MVQQAGLLLACLHKKVFDLFPIGIMSHRCGLLRLLCLRMFMLLLLRWHVLLLLLSITWLVMLVLVLIILQNSLLSLLSITSNQLEPAAQHLLTL